jgi:hypothetical protein
MEQRSAERVRRDQPDVREAWEMALRRKKWVRWIVSWLPHRLTIAARTLLRLQHLVIAKLRHRWRRSLQLRVVGTTLVISAKIEQDPEHPEIVVTVRGVGYKAGPG